MAIRIYGNRSLKTLPGQDTRPTVARVREALFNIWQGTIADCRWLDICAGSGSMGAEALARGAAEAIALEQSSRACAIVRDNWRSIARPPQQFRVLCGDAVRLLGQLDRPFDRIYFDPPYASDLYEPVLQAIARGPLLAVNGECAVEFSPKPTASQWQPPAQVGALQLDRIKPYGNSALAFYRLASDA